METTTATQTPTVILRATGYGACFGVDTADGVVVGGAEMAAFLVGLTTADAIVELVAQGFEVDVLAINLAA